MDGTEREPQQPHQQGQQYPPQGAPVGTAAFRRQGRALQQRPFAGRLARRSPVDWYVRHGERGGCLGLATALLGGEARGAYLRSGRAGPD